MKVTAHQYHDIIYIILMIQELGLYIVYPFNWLVMSPLS